ncbi:hypothetical protein N7448_001694 [Penicillium atrosanguineum]|uniref:Uncharacterized protein n=1 Tax=Penicillium atrosanguineum TaxID=1132637 RepID=A0A9W9HK55_9EURO|nr:uncharacterized protein N7443_005091 [Penicillium atrosanguineum]KAJ5133276.1 hypothetical protein N7526_004641 [Penicillium atrosanguineum]KAJ5150116.1 hypothetical protein N7448_001694 [Penicillium atrosanguineum]KAJ5305431.1 hypothetical protein N7443_005091 [Penicillium atrosanguineum]KAJ5324892.1 hypothetical protein N7476_003492 [Penicillium atrosanguineum]
MIKDHARGGLKAARGRSLQDTKSAEWDSASPSGDAAHGSISEGNRRRLKASTGILPINEWPE